MICMFSNENMADGEIRCPVCGFTHMNFTEEGGSEVIKNMLLSYKQRRRQPLRRISRIRTSPAGSS